MRDSTKRLKIKRLFVLGAGASYSATLGSTHVAPLDKDFCRRIANLNRKVPKWLVESVQRIVGEWRDHQSFEEFGLESALIRHLSHLQFYSAIYRRGGGKRPMSAAEYVDQLIHVVAFILRQCRESKKCALQQLANIAFPKGTQTDQDGAARIVTFNYDDLIDQHILSSFSPQQVYFDRLRDNEQEPAKRKQQFDYPLLVKLHGSVNWRCKTEELKKITALVGEFDKPHELDSIWFDEAGKPSPKDDQSPCIVPPMPNKPITNISIFRYLWSLACEYLSEAKELVICGYSLPETDSLAVSLFGRTSVRSLEKVTVVDPNPAILTRWRQLLHKGKKQARWEYHADFGEYVELLES